MSVPAHRIEIYDRNDNFLAIIDKWTSIQYSQFLNQPSILSFGLDMSDPKVTETNLTGGQNYIKYYRGTQLRWAGKIIAIDDELGADDAPVMVTCGDIFYHLKDRFITTEEIYSSTNEGEILQSLVDYTQAISDGDLGITFGVNTSTETRYRTYFDKNIQEAFMEMSRLQDGLDFVFTPNKVLNIYEDKYTDRTATHVFSYPENVNRFKRVRSWEDMKNDIKTYGGDGIIRTADNTSSQAIYGRRQSIESYTDLILNASLDKTNSELLVIHANPIRTYDIEVNPYQSPLFGTYEIGDHVTLKINKHYIDLDQTMRIYGWNVSIDDSGYETITLSTSQTL